MNKFSVALLGAFVAVAAPSLSGCQTDPVTEIPETDSNTATVVEDDAVNMDADMMDVDGDSVEAGLDEAGNAIGGAAERTGAAIETGAERAGAAVEDAARDAGDVIDENVDLGENAENQ